MIDEQYDQIVELLNSCSITFWLDSGTLLGIMRENRLMKNDGDIDICIWEEDKDLIKKIIPALKKAGYKVYTASYKGLLFEYKFIAAGSGKRQIHIDVYRKWNEYAWCPSYHFKIYPHKSQGRKSIIKGIIRTPLRFLWRKLMAAVPLNISVSSWPWKGFIDIGTWLVPKTFFENTIYLEAYKAYVPEAWDNYLAYRYGSWRIPVKDWVFHQDDGAIRNVSPHKISSDLP